LVSIINQSYKNIVIYAIDNCSKDNSYTLATSVIPDLAIEKSDFNYGFAAGNNRLAKKAIARGAEHLFILNTDMILHENCIYELVTLLESDDTIGAVSPIVLFGRNAEKTNIIQSYLEQAEFKKGKTHSPYNGTQLDENDVPEKAQVTVLFGGALIIKKELYDKIGLFHEQYFMYQDEIDFAYRVNRTNMKQFVTRKAIVWHFHDWSKKNKTGYYREYFYINRNRFLYLRKHKYFLQLIVEIIKQILIFPGVTIWSIRKAGCKLIYFYYLGILHGVLNRQGKASIEFI